MTLRLILTRHAKSSWDDPLMSDHDRTLNKRGRESASAIGRWLAKEGYRPDQAFVSSAERTRETWDLISKAGFFDVEPDIAPSLYLAEPDVVLNILKGAKGKTVFVTAHNPGMAYTAKGLLAVPHADSTFDRYPTGATSIIEFDEDDWSHVMWRAGRLVDFVVPRALIAAEEANAAAPSAPEAATA